MKSKTPYVITAAIYNTKPTNSCMCKHEDECLTNTANLYYSNNASGGEQSLRWAQRWRVQAVRMAPYPDVIN